MGEPVTLTFEVCDHKYVHLETIQKVASNSLSSGNRAQFKRDGDAEVIERWLGLRGFIVGAGGVSDE